jgi:small subunit ribosomal protein S9
LEERLAAIEYYGTGRRKSAVARVYLREGGGAIFVNRKPVDVFIPNESLKMLIRQPLKTTETAEKFDIHAFVKGGGLSGQAGAIRHGIARALVQFNQELRDKLKKGGFLTRDARVKERKKYGQPGARKRFQFSKR